MDLCEKLVKDFVISVKSQSLPFPLKKESDTAAFPPKRVRNSNPKVLEHRRAALEIYLQKMLSLASTKQQVLNFLGIDGLASEINHNGIQKDCNEKASRSDVLGHHPVLIFRNDPYTQTNTSSGLPDIVTNGVLLGIYKS